MSDELKRLDFFISLRLACRDERTQPGPLDHLRGLVITEEEIASIMSSRVVEGNASNPCGHSHPNLQVAAEAIHVLNHVIDRRLTLSRESGMALSLPRLASLFRLSEFETHCLIACLGPELDRKYGKLYAFLQDDVTRKKPSIDLLLSLFCPGAQERLAARKLFASDATLLKFRLLLPVDNPPDNLTPLLSRFLKLDERIVSFLLGESQLDARIAAALQPPVRVEELQADSFPSDLRDRICTLIRSSGQDGNPSACVFVLLGAPGSGRRALAESVASHLGAPLIHADTARLLDGPVSFGEGAWLAGREALLRSAFLCFSKCHSLPQDHQLEEREASLLRAAHEFAPVTFLLTDRPWKPRRLSQDQCIFHLEIPALEASKRRAYWRGALPQHESGMGEEDWSALASKFRFTAGQIRDAASAARTLASWRSPGHPAVTLGDLYGACREQSEPKFGRLARKIEPRHEWRDIVLPEDSVVQLKELCRQVDHRDRVLGDWGFERKLSGGKGTNALFAGPSGTGKTMAAEVIARELNLNLYKIDLSQIVSKYIGETEKNLDAVFSAAESANAVLFFDEADALFGKRSEVREAHDRYANIEISYLLQKMEEYDGVAVLATNLRQNLDDALVRRLAFTIQFPFPDEADRRRIWSCVWPEQTPLAKDMDFDFLARHFQLSGGNIKNVALAASYLAAGNGGVVKMTHILQATRREYHKMGKVLPEPGFNPPEVTGPSPGTFPKF